MKVTTTIKQFGQTMQVEMEVWKLSYKQLQAYIKEAKEQGFTSIKLNVSKEALQAEVEAIEANKAKAALVAAGHLENADQQVKTQTVTYSGNNTVTVTDLEPGLVEVSHCATATTVYAPACSLDDQLEVIDTEVELAEEYRMEGCELVSATAEELEALEVAYQAPESDWIEPKAEVELYTEAMAAEDDELTAGVELACDLPEPYDYYEVDSENGKFRLEDDANYLVRVWYCDLACDLWDAPIDPLDQEYFEPSDRSEPRTYKAVWYNDDDIHCECAVTWYCTHEEALQNLEKLNSRVSRGKYYLACYLEGSELPYGYQYGATWGQPEPYIHPELGLVNGGSLTTVKQYTVYPGHAQVMTNTYPVIRSHSRLAKTAKVEVTKDVFETWNLKLQPPTDSDCIYDDSGSELYATPPRAWANVKEALLKDDDFKAAYDVTPDLRQAFKDTTAHYRVTHKEPLLVAAINNTYGFLTSKLVAKTLRSAWFWSYASLCVLWVMVQLTWQGLKLAARVTHKAYKLATSPEAIALYDIVITQTLTILCNLTDYAETRWWLLWGFLDAGIELAIGLLPKRQPGLVKVEYFLD